MSDLVVLSRSLAEDLRRAANMADWEDPSSGWGDVVKETDVALSAPASQKTRIDYEQETPGPTGYYRNLVEYDDIIAGWDDQLLITKFESVIEQLVYARDDMPTNSVRRELMARARRKMREEALRRMTT